MLFSIHYPEQQQNGPQGGRERPILGGVQVSARERQYSLQVLPVPDTFFLVLIPQGMEGSPREEVFLGAFQFQPENIIQTFQLQVPEKSCPAEHLLSALCAGLYPGDLTSSPNSPGRCTTITNPLDREGN